MNRGPFFQLHFQLQKLANFSVSTISYARRVKNRFIDKKFISPVNLWRKIPKLGGMNLTHEESIISYARKT